MMKILLKFLLSLFLVIMPTLGHAEDVVSNSGSTIVVLNPKPNSSKPRKPVAVSTITCSYNDGLLKISLPWTEITSTVKLYHQNTLISIETITCEENVLSVPTNYDNIDIELQLENGYIYVGTINLE